MSIRGVSAGATRFYTDNNILEISRQVDTKTRSGALTVTFTPVSLEELRTGKNTVDAKTIKDSELVSDAVAQMFKEGVQQDAQLLRTSEKALLCLQTVVTRIASLVCNLFLTIASVAAPHAWEECKLRFFSAVRDTMDVGAAFILLWNPQKGLELMAWNNLCRKINEVRIASEYKRGIEQYKTLGMQYQTPADGSAKDKPYQLPSEANEVLTRTAKKMTYGEFFDYAQKLEHEKEEIAVQELLLRTLPDPDKISCFGDKLYHKNQRMGIDWNRGGQFNPRLNGSSYTQLLDDYLKRSSILQKNLERIDPKYLNENGITTLTCIREMQIARHGRCDELPAQLFLSGQFRGDLDSAVHSNSDVKALLLGQELMKQFPVNSKALQDSYTKGDASFEHTLPDGSKILVRRKDLEDADAVKQRVQELIKEIEDEVVVSDEYSKVKKHRLAFWKHIDANLLQKEPEVVRT